MFIFNLLPTQGFVFSSSQHSLDFTFVEVCSGVQMQSNHYPLFDSEKMIYNKEAWS